MIKEFKEFISRGNVVDLAVGVIIGAAFGKIVSSLVNDIIMPPVGLILGGINFSDFKLVLKSAGVDPSGKVIEAVALNYGAFVQSGIDFLIIAIAIFLFVKGFNSMKRREEDKKVTVPEPTAEERLLTEIRDLLAKK
jgi:large conductance mechanosensitive channel